MEDILPLAPIVSLGIFLPILLAFLEIQNSEIYSDALTGLNNRRRMEIFLQDMIHNSSESEPFRIHIVDVNDFKQVNDKFGHIAGDRALQLVADALHNVSDRLHGFCARYGGDEFVLITRENAEIRETVQKEVDALRESCSDLIPKITVCTGVHCVPPELSRLPSSSLRRTNSSMLKRRYSTAGTSPKPIPFKSEYTRTACRSSTPASSFYFIIRYARFCLPRSPRLYE